MMMYKWLDLCTFVPNIPRTSKEELGKCDIYKPYLRITSMHILYMKRKIQWMLAAILIISSTSVMTSCSEDDDNDSPKGKTDIEQQRLEEWEPCNKLTYISGIDSEDPDLQNVIRQRFPN